MKILFLTPRDSKTNLGGVERHVKLLTEELVRRGHRVKELSLEETNKSYKGYKNHKEEKREKKDKKGEKIRSWMYLWNKRGLFKWADIIHVHDVFWWVMPFLLCHSARRHLKRRIFVTFHGWEGRYPPTRSAVWQKKLAAFLSDGTIGVGNFFEKWYGVKTDRVVWGAIDKLKVKSEKLKVDKNRYSVVFFGRLEEVNGVGVVIKAMKSIKDSPWHTPGRILFLFVGDGSYRREAEKVGSVTGMVAEPWKYLVDAEVVIASSYLAILEAAAMGKRIIAVADNPLKRDYLDCHPLRKYFKICRSVDELAREVIKRSHPGFRQGDSFQNRERAKSWALGQTAEKLRDEYEELWDSIEETPRLGGESPLRVSVVITVKDDPEGERKLMEALAGQTVKPDEVVVVRAEEHGNCSRGKGRNIGVRKARNEVIAVTDAGCRPHRDWLEKMIANDANGLKRMNANKRMEKKPIVVAGWYRAAARRPLQKIMAYFLVPAIEKEEKDQKDKRGEGNLPASRSIMFTKKAWELAGGYPEEAVSGAEDLEFARRLKEHPDVKMIYCPEAVVDWEAPATLGEFFRDIVKHTRGNVEVGYWPHLWRNLTVVLRWIAIGIWPWLGIAYLGWIVGKGIKIIKVIKIINIFWLPIVQLVADGGVIWGLISGILGTSGTSGILGILGKLGRFGKLGKFGNIIHRW